MAHRDQRAGGRCRGVQQLWTIYFVLKQSAHNAQSSQDPYWIRETGNSACTSGGTNTCHIAKYLHYLFMCVILLQQKTKEKKRKSMWSFKKKPRRKCLPQGRAQETLWGLRNKLFAMFKIQQISPKNVLKRGSPKCTFSTLFHHLHIYFFLAYLDVKNMFSPGQNVHRIKQTN